MDVLAVLQVGVATAGLGVHAAVVRYLLTLASLEETYNINTLAYPNATESHYLEKIINVKKITFSQIDFSALIY